MKSNVLISIIVPIYGVEKYIKKCIDSIISQSYVDIEIILVDDGSKDNCPYICDEYEQKDLRVKVIHKPNGGLVSARKAGINFASGEYVVYVDGDDWIDEDYIQNFVLHIRDNSNLDIIWALDHHRNYKEKEILSGYLKYSQLELKSEDIQNELYSLASGKEGYQNLINFGICAKCYKREFFIGIENSLDDRISFDEDFCQLIRCFANDPSILFVRNDGYHYLQRDDSMTHSLDTNDINRIMLDDTLLYLKRCSKPYLERYTITQYYISMIQHGGLCNIQRDELDTIIPFRNAYKGKKIVIYGIGNAGVSILEYFRNSHSCDVIAICDGRYINGQKYNEISVVDVCELKKMEFDYVLISTIRTEFIDEIKNKLLVEGIKSEKISYIDFDMLSALEV